MNGDSSAEEIYSRRTSLTSHKVDHNFWGVRHPNLNFWSVRTPTTPTGSGCATAYSGSPDEPVSAMDIGWALIQI